MMVPVGSLQGASMVSLAPVASTLGLGSCTSSSSSEVSFSLVRRVFLLRGRGYKDAKIWHCRCSITTTTDFIAEQSNTIALDSNNGYGVNRGDDSGLELKAAPKPMLKPPVPRNNSSVSLEGISSKSDDGSSNERNTVIKSLDEVLEKAEKLETSKFGESTSKREFRPSNVQRPPKTNAYVRGARVVDSAAGKPAKSTKSVWRKGDTVQKVAVVKDPPSVKKEVEVPGNKTGGEENVELQPRVSFALPRPSLAPPRPPLRPQPKLQIKPAVAPPAARKPVVLKDVGASPKSAALKDVGAASKLAAPEEADAPAKPKERKQPILVDKFASKKAAGDLLAAQGVLSPSKPGKGPPGKARDDFFRKKNVSGSALRRRKADDDDEEISEDASDMNVSIPGAARKKGRKWNKASRRAARIQAAKEAAPVKVDILEVDEKGMLVEELAYNLATSEGEILGYLYSKGIKPDGVQTIDQDMVKMVCKQYGVEVIDADPIKVEEMARKREIFDEEDLDKLEYRPPVLTIMGHVDHGKTTLLDHIRKSKVAASEAGGITQGIGAYKVMVPVDGKPQTCVFLDTPGHEAFGAMRARGARVTDIAIIVVAADDGIRPQTNEAIAHAKAAGVPIVVAINKIDKDGASPDRVMQELSSIGLMPEEWGGETPMVQISALKGQNVDDLLETVMLVAELQELKANPHRNAKGTVIEAALDKSKGPIATFIVQKGTMKRGDVVVCGEAFGKVRALFDDSGKRVDEAGPSMPIQVIGLNNVPIAGDEFEVVDSLDVARERAELRADSLRDEHISAKAGDGKITLSSLASAVSRKLPGLDLHQLNIIMKVDFQGSIEAVRQALEVLPQDNVTLKFLLQAPGDINVSDVDLGVASKAIVFGFNVKVPGSVKTYADNKGVEIRLYRVIYDLIDDVRKAMEGLLDSVEEQENIGFAEVRAVFSSGSGRVAGCMVTEGKVVKGCGIRVLRRGRSVYVGTLDSLKRVKEVVKEVSAGLECGIGADDYDDWVEGDSIEAFNTVEKKRTLEEASASMAAALEGVGM